MTTFGNIQQVVGSHDQPCPERPQNIKEEMNKDEKSTFKLNILRTKILKKKKKKQPYFFVCLFK